MPLSLVRIPSNSKNVDLNSISFSSERKQVKSRVLVKLGRGSNGFYISLGCNIRQQKQNMLGLYSYKITLSPTHSK